jgi:hypothetical protein
MAAAINGKPPAAPTPSSFAYLPAPLFKLAHEPLRLPFAPAALHSTHVSPIPPTPPPRVPAAAVNSSPPVKDWSLHSFFLILGIAKGLTSTCYRRFLSPTPVAAAPRPHRSAARSAAVAKFPHRRLLFDFELAFFFYTW